MAVSFDRVLARLRRAAWRFDEAGHGAKREVLARLHALPLPAGRALQRYHELLLFLRAHPGDRVQLAAVEAALRRIASALRTRPALAAGVEDEGLPFIGMTAQFGHDCVRWLLTHPHCKVAIASYDKASADLNSVLRLTLPAAEHSETTAGLDNDALLDALCVRPRQRLEFLVNELARLDHAPAVKDQLFDMLGLFVRIEPRDRRFSKAFNRLPMRAVHFQRTLLRDFDARALIDTPLPAPRRLDPASRSEALRVLKTVFVLTQRETDPCTHLDQRTLRIVDLEHGLSVAVYGEVAARQLAYESYVGFTLFRNGMATAYGGAWLLGPRAGFGMNIFEPYRGGESGFMMCQVLRTYRQLFGVSYFEVDGSQFGRDSPEGIASGAFWFYYRYGFRPLDPALARLAEQERQRNARKPGRRSNQRTLTRLADSNAALAFAGGRPPPHVYTLGARVTRLVARRYGGDRAAAERASIRAFEARTGRLRPRDPAQRRVLSEVALLAAALGIEDARRLGLLRRMIAVKPRDLFAYQRLCLAFFSINHPVR